MSGGFATQAEIDAFWHRVLKSPRPVHQLAKELNRRHGADPGRVLPVLRRLHAAGWLDEDPFAGDLDLALSVMGAEGGLRMFEAFEPEVLQVCFQTVAYLIDSRTPLYSLDELDARIEALLGRLHANRDSFVATGWPEFPIDDTIWPDCYFTVLYRTKQPFGIHREESDTSASVLLYDWPSLAPEPADVGRPATAFLLDAEGVVRIRRGTVVERVPYERAPHIPGITPADVAHAASIRPRFHELRNTILRELQRAIRRRDASRLWSDCLSLVTDVLDDGDRQLMSRLDRYLLGTDLPASVADERGSNLSCGGLTELFEVIGHVEQELLIGDMRRTREDLAVFFEPEAPPLKHYFQAFPDRWVELNVALVASWEREPAVATFWAGFRQRVRRAFDEEFFVAVANRVRQKNVPSFMAKAEQLARYLEVADIASAGDRFEHTPRRSNSLRRLGAHWLLRFQGHETTLGHGVGVQLVHRLLRQRDEWLAAVELDAAIDPAPTDANRTVERARQRLTHGLDRMLRDLREDEANEPAWCHFMNQIDRGHQFRYRLPDGIAWDP